MKPFYASALIFFTVCSLWIAADAPYANRHRNVDTTHYDVGFSSVGALRH